MATGWANGAASRQKKTEVPSRPAETRGELAAFSSKVEGIRNLSIENQDGVVGQPKVDEDERWVDFKRRAGDKLEENALGYLVKKWNDLEVRRWRARLWS